VVGITGGVGSGKTVVSRHLGSLGCHVIDADGIARHLVDQHTDIQNQLKHAFGSQVFDTSGKLKRRELGKIVFQDSNKLKKLNQIIQPILIEKIKNQISIFQKRNQGMIIVVDMAIIFEAEVDDLFDNIVVVNTPEDKRIKWLSKNRNWSVSEIQQRMHSQFKIQYKKNRADFIVENESTMDDLRIKTEELFQNIISERQ